VTASADDGEIGARDLLDLAVTTARAAGELIVEGRRGQVRVAETKSSPTDVVTDNDVASERLIPRNASD